METRQTMFCVRFYAAVATLIARRIVRLNGGRWPRTLAQWQVVTGKARYVLLLVADAPRVHSCCLFGERVILVQYSPDEREFHRRIAHEVAHALIAVGGPSGSLLDWPRDEDECHFTARLVEGFVDIAFAEDGQLSFDLEV